MTVYQWKCPVCRTRIDAPGTLPCPVCGNMMTKDWSAINLRIPVFKPHFNHAVGQYVETSRAFDEALRRGGEEANSSYTRIDPGDYESLTPSSHTEIIEESARVHRDRGLTPSPTTSIIAL